MKKIIVACFAHPDDEAFGTSGMLYKAARSGSDVHLVLVTDGCEGCNPDGCDDLAAARLKEWQKSGRLMGAASLKSFGYKDGTLCNNLYLEVAGKLLNHSKEILAAYDEPTELTYLTYDPGGVTGHLDHIAVSMISTYAYHKLKDDLPENCMDLKLMYACLSKDVIPKVDLSWLYMPAGRDKEQIDKIVNVSDIYDKKIEIMKAHTSQRADMERLLSRGQDAVACECYWYLRD